MKKATQVFIDVPVRHIEDFPTELGLDLKDNRFQLTVDLKTGTILTKDFPKLDVEISVFLKVCDEGIYILQDKDGKEIDRVEEDYVPECIPNEYGDYIDFNIKNGVITNWDYDGNYLYFKE